MKQILKVTWGVFFLVGGIAVRGQYPAPGGLPAGLPHVLMDVVANVGPFYGTLNVQIPNGTNESPRVVSCSISVTQGALRLEADAFDAGSNMPPAEAEQLKQMHFVTILRPGLNRAYLVYPRFKSYVELAYGGSTGTNSVPLPTIAKTDLGKDTVGEQPCLKSQWNIVEPSGEHYDATVWQATNLSNFPIQIKVSNPPSLVVFQDWHLEAPDNSLFGPPADYKKYEGIQENIRRQLEKQQTNGSQ